KQVAPEILVGSTPEEVQQDEIRTQGPDLGVLSVQRNEVADDSSPAQLRRDEDQSREIPRGMIDDDRDAPVAEGARSLAGHAAPPHPASTPPARTSSGSLA